MILIRDILLVFTVFILNCLVETNTQVKTNKQTFFFSSLKLEMHLVQLNYTVSKPVQEKLFQPVSAADTLVAKLQCGCSPCQDENETNRHLLSLESVCDRSERLFFKLECCLCLCFQTITGVLEQESTVSSAGLFFLSRMSMLAEVVFDGCPV